MEENVKDWAGDVIKGQEEQEEVDAIEIDDSDLEDSGVEPPSLFFGSPMPDGTFSQPMREDFQISLEERANKPKNLVLPTKEKLQKHAGIPSSEKRQRSAAVLIQDLSQEVSKLRQYSSDIGTKYDRLQKNYRGSVAQNSLLIEQNQILSDEIDALQERVVERSTQADSHLFQMRKIWWTLRWQGGYDPATNSNQEPYVWMRSVQEIVGDLPEDWNKK